MTALRIHMITQTPVLTVCAKAFPLSSDVMNKGAVIACK